MEHAEGAERCLACNRQWESYDTLLALLDLSVALRMCILQLHAGAQNAGLENAEVEITGPDCRGNAGTKYAC